MSDASASNPSLEARLARLEAIVASLDRDDLELEQALALFEEGIAQLRDARRILEETELRISRLLDDGDGGTTLEPMGQDGD